MRRLSIRCCILLLITILSAHLNSKACTNILITPGASADGSSLVSYSADSHWLFGDLYFQPAARWAPGTRLSIREWDSNRYLGEIAQAPRTYKTVGNMNEHQLIIGETTWGGRRELSDSTGIMDYGTLIYVALQRAKTAREAIQVIVDLANEHGYCSGGESFSIADKNEVWVMELIGKGAEKGIVWVARRIPDGFICAHANQARIQTFPLNDPENCLYAADVISFARKKGYFSGEDRDFDFAEAYGPYDFGTVRGCDARVWSAFNRLSDGEFTYEDESGKLITRPAKDFLLYAMGYDLQHGRLPLFIRPAGKISVKDVADAMRDHYEGTPMDMTLDIGAGGNALPYRWRPMDWEYDGETYANERAIATQQTGFWFVGQARKSLPDLIGGILWFGTDDAATSYLTPIYTNTDEIPECFKVGNGDLLTYSPTASFWVNNRVSNACYKAYNLMAPTVVAEIDRFENEQMTVKVAEMDAKALAAYHSILPKAEKKGLESKDWFAPVRKMLTDYSVNTAQTQFHNWVKLEELLLVKFIDGNVKAQNEDGTFKRSPHSAGIPAGLTQPGYTEHWKKVVAGDRGAIIKVPR